MSWSRGGLGDGGLEQEADYPYDEPHLNDCQVDKRKEVVGVLKYTTILGEENM